MGPKYCAYCAKPLRGYTTSNNRGETANCDSYACRNAEAPVYHVHSGNPLTPEEIAWHATTRALWRAFLDRPAYPGNGNGGA